MKKITLSGYVVGKSVSPIWENRVKTDKNKHFIQILDIDKDEFNNVRAVITDVKVTENTFNQIDLAPVLANKIIEIDIKETAVDGRLYYAEIN